VRVAEAEAVEVGDDRNEREAEADEALPPLGDRAADSLATPLVEDAAGGGAGRATNFETSTAMSWLSIWVPSP